MTDARAAIERYIAHLRVERRYSPRTLQAYADDLRRLGEHAFGAALRGDWSRVRHEDVRAFAAAEHRQGQSGKSVQRRLSACRGFYRFLMREGLAQANPAQGVRAPKSARALPHVLDADETAALLALPDDTTIAARDRAMLELFYSSALRLSELCALRWPDVDLDDAMVRVTGKGAKTRIVPMGSKAVQALRAWRAQGTAGAQGAVFPGRGGGALSPRAVQARLKYWATRLGIWKRVHPHVLRHSCASHLLESSGDLRGVQEMLGHADISTTQVYTHLDFQHLAKVYDAAHPRARRK
jgi:integrase/recombinase XerC